MFINDLEVNMTIMKYQKNIKFVLVFSLFFISFFFACKTITKEHIDNTTTKVLSEKQLWAIALTGIMSERNRSNHISLSTSQTGLRDKGNWLEVLRRDWGINTREELLETLYSMENGGHAASLREIQEIIYEVSTARNESETTAILSKYYWDQTKVNRFNYTIQNWEIYQNRTILAWDLGRNISLCRWGYDVGFLTENEAWEKIIYYAKIIQPLYKSWEEYGYEYYMGRVFWASGFGESSRYSEETYPIYEKLINRNGLWYNLEWNIDLN
jgi:hypothetical protein